jgi:hypothetical protein
MVIIKSKMIKKLRIKKKNKKAWVKMVEVFISIMLITASLVLVLNKNVFTGEVMKEVDGQMTYILRTIQIKEVLRSEIINSNLPVEWEDFESSGLSETRAKIIEKTPGNLECQAKVCELDDACINDAAPADTNVYSKATYISSDLETYNPRQLKLFCWRKISQ